MTNEETRTVELKFKSAFSPVWVLIAAFALTMLLVINYLLVNSSVASKKTHWKELLVAECARSVVAEFRGETDELRLRTKARKLEACSDIRIQKVSASTGIIGPVEVRIDLDGRGYIPYGKPTRKLSMRSTCIFPLTLYYVLIDDWPVAEFPEAGNATIEL